MADYYSYKSEYLTHTDFAHPRPQTNERYLCYYELVSNYPNGFTPSVFRRSAVRFGF